MAPTQPFRAPAAPLAVIARPEDGAHASLHGSGLPTPSLAYCSAIFPRRPFTVGDLGNHAGAAARNMAA